LKFVGIDLAWGEQKPSGVAVIDSQGVVQKAAANLIGNVEICQFAGLDSSEGAVIAIDSPLVVNNPGKCRPVEEMLTKTFWPYDAAPYPANLSNKAFHEAGRIRQLVKYLEAQGFMQSPIIPKQQEQQSFLEVFPSPALVMLFPGGNRVAHLHCRALRYKHKQGRAWAEVQSEWEIYRARLRSLERREPALKFSDDVRKKVGIDITDHSGVAYKAFDDLLDGILCAYLAYYYWYWGEEGCWVVGDTSTGYVTLPRCRLKNCEIAENDVARRSQPFSVDLLRI
jgi:predicted RNase H-like nuclease